MVWPAQSPGATFLKLPITKSCCLGQNLEKSLKQTGTDSLVKADGWSFAPVRPR